MKWFYILFSSAMLCNYTVVAQNRQAIDSIKNRLADFETVSMMQLIATPNLYNGKRVQVSGFIHIKFEDRAIYYSKEQADYLTVGNSIWLDFSGSISAEPLYPKKYRDINYFDGKYVVIRGRFSSKDKGHLGNFAGSIIDIDYIFESPRKYDGSRSFPNYWLKDSVIDNK